MTGGLFKHLFKLLFERSLLEKVTEGLEFLVYNFLFTAITVDLPTSEVAVNTEYFLTQPRLALGQLGLEEREVVLVSIVSHQTDGPLQSSQEPLQQLHGAAVELGLPGEVVVVEAGHVGDQGHDGGHGVETQRQLVHHPWLELLHL